MGLQRLMTEIGTDPNGYESLSLSPHNFQTITSKNQSMVSLGYTRFADLMDHSSETTSLGCCFSAIVSGGDGVTVARRTGVKAGAFFVTRVCLVG